MNVLMSDSGIISLATIGNPRRSNESLDEYTAGVRGRQFAQQRLNHYGGTSEHGYWRPLPTSTDTDIVTQTNPETKQTANVLVKRGKEMHEPDRMYLNPHQIVFVEPVSPSSKVAQLIAEAPQK